MAASGLYLVHKPKGQSSFATLEAFRAAHPAPGPRRVPMCHGGVLDPFAHGLLVLLAGPATKLMPRLHAAPKRYVAQVVWGLETDTGDAGGRPVTLPVTDPAAGGWPPSPQALDEALAGFVGWKDQVPPNTSNKRVDGERAWQKAHRGEAFTLPPSRVYLHEARWGGHTAKTSELFLTCGGGFYVRALARDLGRRLGCGAHLGALHRVGIGPWEDPGRSGPSSHLAGSDVLPWLPTRMLSDAEVGALRKGEPVLRGQVHPPGRPLPSTFVKSSPESVMALHLGRLVMLLSPVPGEPDRLTLELSLGRGL